VSEDEIIHNLEMMRHSQRNLFFDAANSFWKTRIQTAFLIKEIAVLHKLDYKIIYAALSFYDRVMYTKQYRFDCAAIHEQIPGKFIHIHTLLTCIILAAKTFKATKYCTRHKPTDLSYTSVCDSVRQLNVFNSYANILCTDFSNISVANYEWITLQALDFEMQTTNVFEIIIACMSIACAVSENSQNLSKAQKYDLINLLMSEDDLFHVFQIAQKFDTDHQFMFFKKRLMLYSDICYLTALYARHTAAHCALACLHLAFADVSKTFSVPTSFSKVYDVQQNLLRACTSNLTELSAIYAKYF